MFFQFFSFLKHNRHLLAAGWFYVELENGKLSFNKKLKVISEDS